MLRNAGLALDDETILCGKALATLQPFPDRGLCHSANARQCSLRARRCEGRLKRFEGGFRRRHNPRYNCGNNKVNSRILVARHNQSYICAL